MAVKKQNWSSRFSSAWALHFTHEDGVRNEIWLFKTKAGAVRRMAQRMKQAMDAYGTPDELRAELEATLAAGHLEALDQDWFNLYQEEYFIDEHEIED